VPAEERSQRVRQMGSGARATGARQALAGAVVNRLVSGANPPLRHSLLKRRARRSPAAAAPITRAAWLAWAVNRRQLQVLAAGASARRLPGRLSPDESSLPGKPPAGNRASLSAPAATPAIQPRRSLNGSRQVEVLLNLPGKAQAPLVSGGNRPRPLRRDPAVPSIRQVPEGWGCHPLAVSGAIVILSGQPLNLRLNRRVGSSVKRQPGSHLPPRWLRQPGLRRLRQRGLGLMRAV
jgi:hypothetical protein